METNKAGIKVSDSTFMGVRISVFKSETRFGSVFYAVNNYGEPKATVHGFATLVAALWNEEGEIARMFA